ncbi:class I SAM-dependent methyltransferase [Mariprofundus ferrooxydans]|nr:class I SAM-dependent methyltransferase [Mariprofundus ferrooxydans]
MSNKQKQLFPEGHFYSPIADLKDIEERQDQIWNNAGEMPGINWNVDGQLQHLEIFKDYVGDIDFPIEDPGDGLTYFYKNDQFPVLDMEVYYSMLNHYKPANIVEVGSGFSSLMVAQVNRELFDNKINFTCIEPYPRQFLIDGVPGISELLVKKVQDVELSWYDRLQENDILFIDSSHVSKVGSDVNHLMFHVLPNLKAGVMVHIHDIFLPDDYPKVWMIDQGRHWNEQYIVQAFLQFNDSFKVLWGGAYMGKYQGEAVKDVFERFPSLGGGGESLDAEGEIGGYFII